MVANSLSSKKLCGIDPPTVRVRSSHDFDGIEHQKAVTVERKRPIGLLEAEVAAPPPARIMGRWGAVPLERFIEIMILFTAIP
jgi:hypothetical protein